MRAINHCIFLRRCIKKAIIPKGLRLKFPAGGSRVSVIKYQAEQSLVRERLRFWKVRRYCLQNDVNEGKEEMQCKLLVSQSERNWSIIGERKEAEFQRSKMAQVKKFDMLMKEHYGWEDRNRGDFRTCVVNMSSCDLSESEVSLLSKGLKFAPGLRRLPLRT